MKLQATKLSGRVEMYPNGVCISSDKFNVLISEDIAYQMTNINDYESLMLTTIPQFYSIELINRVRELYGKEGLIKFDPELSKLVDELKHERQVINRAIIAMNNSEGGLDDMDGFHEALEILESKKN